MGGRRTATLKTLKVSKQRFFPLTAGPPHQILQKIFFEGPPASRTFFSQEQKDNKHFSPSQPFKPSVGKENTAHKAPLLINRENFPKPSGRSTAGAEERRPKRKEDGGAPNVHPRRKRKWAKREHDKLCFTLFFMRATIVAAQGFWRSTSAKHFVALLAPKDLLLKLAFGKEWRWHIDFPRGTFIFR